MESLMDAPTLGELSDLSMPILIIKGVLPSTVGDGAEQLARALGSADLVVIQGAGHDPWLDQPRAFFAAIRQFFANRHSR